MTLELERTDYGAAASAVGPRARASEANLFTGKTGAKVLLLRSLGGGNNYLRNEHVLRSEPGGGSQEELNIGSNISYDPTPTFVCLEVTWNLRLFSITSGGLQEPLLIGGGAKNCVTVWRVGLELHNCVFTRTALKLGRTSDSQSEAHIALYPGQLCPALHKDDMLPAVTLQHL